jgi:ketosteroid isomerase-like protein
VDDLGSKDAVHDVIMRFFLAADEGRSEDVGALVTEDAVLAIHIPGAGSEGRSFAYEGRSGFVKHAASFGRAMGFIRHHCTTCLVEVDGDKAAATSYYLALREKGLDHFGRLDDEFVRVDGKWLIARRTASTTMTRSREDTGSEEAAVTGRPGQAPPD